MSNLNNTFDCEESDTENLVIFDCARKVLLAGAWLIENGHGRLALLPYVYATGHWRCEFHVVGRPKKTVFRYSIANGSSYLASHCGGTIRKGIGHEKLARAIWVSVPQDIKDTCSGAASPETLEWLAELRRQLGLGFIPAAFGEYFGDKVSWHLSDLSNRSYGLTMPAMPGYVNPGEENSVLDDVFWTKAELLTRRLGKRSEVTLPGEALRDGDHVYEIANRLRRDMADADHFEAMRLFKAAICALRSATIASYRRPEVHCEVEISTKPSIDPVIKRATRLLSMVHELHKAGYQRLRVACGWDTEVGAWRARLMPSSQVSDDGWSPILWTAGVNYSTVDGKAYFGWADATSDDARSLANKFIRRFPQLAVQASGEDWAYAGWFSSVLGAAEHGELPAFFGLEVDESTSFPPPPVDNASAHDHNFISTTGFPLIANDELTLANLPRPGAVYEEVVPFCLSFDGYKGGMLEGSDLWAIAKKATRVGIANCGMDSLRSIAFIHQRQLKNDSDSMIISGEHPSMYAIGQVIAEIRRRLDQ